jgi:hypothetical protein
MKSTSPEARRNSIHKHCRHGIHDETHCKTSFDGNRLKIVLLGVKKLKCIQMNNCFICIQNNIPLLNTFAEPFKDVLKSVIEGLQLKTGQLDRQVFLNVFDILKTLSFKEVLTLGKRKINITWIV